MINSIQDYIDYCIEQYGKRPSEKRIREFCKLNNVPLPDSMSDEEVPQIIAPKVDLIFGQEGEG